MLAAADPLIDIAFKRHARELRDTWQGRVLARSLRLVGEFARPLDLEGAAMLSVLAHNFDDGMPVLLRVVFPGFVSIGAPFLCSAARIAKTGHIMADIITRTGQRMRNQAIFKDKRAMESAFRRRADEARLSDAERLEMFDAVKRWVVCDYRLDPGMDPRDPDAVRLVN